MNIRNNFKSLTPYLLLLLLLCSHSVRAQFVKTIHSYMPAPGQYTNTEQIGQPNAAQSIIGKLDGLVSLGGYGGAIVLGFEKSIENDPKNPYGVDFTIFGNATTTWSEAGIVQVMRDDNGNGLPDDTWYEIAGSDHYFSTTKQNYQITYQNPGDGIVADINWSDNLGQTGIMKANSYHQQPYYPMMAYFPEVNTEKLITTGTLLSGIIDLSLATQVLVKHRSFGYADNTKVLSTTENSPDNPYTEAIEGSGGDAIDISWARDANNNFVDLDKIDFVRIYTGMNNIAGWLGEISTEIAGIRDVEPQEVTGTTEMVVIEDLPKNVFKNEIQNLNAYSFSSGKQDNETIEWVADKPDLVKIENKKLTALKAGTVVLKAQNASKPSVYAEHELKIISEGQAKINLTTTTVQKNDKLKLTGKITDTEGNLIPGINGTWRSANPHVFSISQEDGQAYLNANNEGKALLYLEAENIPDISSSVEITVLAESTQKKVFISVKTSEKNLVPRQSINISIFDLNSFVDSRSGDYSLESLKKITAAHAVTEVFKKIQTVENFKFRDDAKGDNQLYIWEIPEIMDGSTLFHYGYGGNRDTDATKKTWLVKINQQTTVVGLDKIEINNNDEILIYQIADNAVAWQFTQLTADKDSLKKNESVEIQRMQFECTMNTDRQVLVSTSKVMTDTEIKIENGTSKRTDEFGKATFSFDKGGEIIASSGIDKLLLDVENTTGTKNMSKQKIMLFPNPATNQFSIKSELRFGNIEVFDFSGRQVLQQEFQANNPIDISQLKPGLYLIRISSDNTIFQQKLIKQ